MLKSTFSQEHISTPNLAGKLTEKLAFASSFQIKLFSNYVLLLNYFGSTLHTLKCVNVKSYCSKQTMIGVSRADEPVSCTIQTDSWGEY